jgi:hypothetical protein
VYKLISLHYHSGSAPGAQVTPPGAYMSQWVPPDPRRYSTVTAITLLNSILTTHQVVIYAQAWVQGSHNS